MKVYRTCRALVLAAAFTAVALSGGEVAFVKAARPTVTPPAAECEGDACSAVTVAFDSAKQQYRAANITSDRWLRVSAGNQVSSVSACLAPGKDAYLPLKSIVAPYRAAFAEARCGAPEGVGR